jgi:hypothetical protein
MTLCTSERSDSDSASDIQSPAVSYSDGVMLCKLNIMHCKLNVLFITSDSTHSRLTGAVALQLHNASCTTPIQVRLIQDAFE